MESYPLFAEIPHIAPVSKVPSQSHDAFDPSLPVDQPFMTRASRFQCQVPPLDEVKPSGPITPQSWWEGGDSSLSTGYFPPEYPAYPDRFSPWNSGLSSISDPQSPRSSNSGSVPGLSCIASHPFRNEDVPITAVDEQGRYPAPDSLAHLDPSIMIPKSNLLEVSSHYEHDLDSWSGSQSDRHITPEQQWPSPLPADSMAFPQPQRRSKARQTSNSRVHKTTEKRPTSATGRNSRRRRATISNNGDGSSSRTFICSFAPYGCESTFVSKNEWKRHITSQHLQLGFYRCDVGKCSLHRRQPSPTHTHLLTPSTSRTQTLTPPSPPGQPNDFNRKDLFTQHQRRMHAPWLASGRRRAPTGAEHAAFEESLDDVRRRCWHGLRQPPSHSHCGFCREVFSGEGSWDVRMEHVGRHFERDEPQSMGEAVEDLSLREWGLREGILVLVDGQCRLASLVGVEA